MAYSRPIFAGYILKQRHEDLKVHGMFDTATKQHPHEWARSEMSLQRQG